MQLGRGVVDFLPRAGIFLAASALLVAVIAGQGTRWDVWHFSMGLRLLRVSVYVACLAGVVSLPGLIVCLVKKERAGALYALVACLLSGVIVGVPAYWASKARYLPAIHDITTDTESPPQFEALLQLRGRASNPPAYGGQQIASQQKRAYPDIIPLILPGAAMERAFERALIGARKMGWNIIAADREKGIIEAVDATRWFGFKDDIVVRLHKVPDGIRVDVRSASRVGISDLGTNATRIRSFLKFMARKT